MVDKRVEIGTYRVLRGLGISKESIALDLPLKSQIESDIDWTLLLFFIESRFHIEINPEQEGKLKYVSSIIDLVRSNRRRL